MDPVLEAQVSSSLLIQEQRIARLGDRVVAGALDAVPLLPIFLAIGGVTAHLYDIPPTPDGRFDLQGGPALLSLSADIVVWCAFYFLLEWLFSTTLGKEAMAIEVRSVKGGRCTAIQSLLRNLLRPIDAIGFYLVAIVAAAISSSNQRIGDRVAGTVVREKLSARRRWAFAGWILMNVLLCYGAIFLVEFVRKG